MKLLQYISNLYEQLVKTGVTEEQSFAEKLRTELCNQFIIIALPATIIHLVYNLLGPNILREYLLVLLWILILSTTLVLNHHKKYLIARIYTILVPMMMVSIILILFGLTIRIDFMYLMYILISCYILEKRYAIGMIALILTTYSSIIVYLSYIPPPFEEHIVPSGGYAYFTFVTIITIVQTTKMLSEHRKHSNTQIQQNQNLARQKKELERFTYIASHDLKSPLNNIIGFADLLEDKLKTSNKKTVLEYLQYVQISAQQMHGLIEDILQLSKIRDNQKQEKTQVDLNELFTEVSNHLNHQIFLNKPTINCQLLPTYFCNGGELSLLFQNLIQNGIKYNQSPIPKIEIWSSTDKENLFLYFQDNGIGISEKNQKEIFQSFKRLHTQGEYEGTGIGLSLCKKILQNHNGQISVISSLQQGSTFVVRLPLATA